jgi:hypothetical protein
MYSIRFRHQNLFHKVASSSIRVSFAWIRKEDASVSDPSSPYGLPPLHIGKVPEPPKRGRMLDFRAMTHGSLVSGPEMARRLGDAYLEILYGTEERDRQQPLVAAELDDCWRIEGNWNRHGALGERGWFYATIWKHDGRLVDFGIHLNIEYSAADRALINKVISGMSGE